MHSVYRHKRNKVNYEIKKPQTNYYNTLFKENARNIKNTWKGINNLIGRGSKTTKITKLETDYNVYTDPNEISNVLNGHFSKIGPSLAIEFQDDSIRFINYITPTDF